MNKKKKIWIIGPVVAVIVIIAVGVMCIYGMMLNKTRYTFVEDLDSSSSYKANDFYVEIVRGKNWVDDVNGLMGAQYDGYFYNNSDIVLTDWEIEFDIPEGSYSDSDWNGDYEWSTNHVKITAVNYNTHIKKSKCETFGFIMYTDGEYHIDSITVSGYKTYSITDFNLFGILMLILLIDVAAMIIDLAFNWRMKKMRMKQEEYKDIIMQSLRTFANIIDTKDSYTKGHSLRVARYAKEIARRAGYPEDEQTRIYQISLLHDIGKIAIDNSILQKPDSLTHEEREEIKLHTNIGGDILADFSAISGIADGARYHHESYDGKGYPTGLSGDAIPECARIICVADSFDTMNSDRCYRKKMEMSVILEEFKRCSGTQFDSRFANYMIDMINEGFVR